MEDIEVENKIKDLLTTMKKKKHGVPFDKLKAAAIEGGATSEQFDTATLTLMDNGIIEEKEIGIVQLKEIEIEERPKYPRSICTCGHEGDGPKSLHIPLAESGDDGLGMCALCNCQGFKFEKFTEKYGAARGKPTIASRKAVEETIKKVALAQVTTTLPVTEERPSLSLPLITTELVPPPIIPDASITTKEKADEAADQITKRVGRSVDIVWSEESANVTPEDIEKAKAILVKAGLKTIPKTPKIYDVIDLHTDESNIERSWRVLLTDGRKVDIIVHKVKGKPCAVSAPAFGALGHKDTIRIATGLQLAGRMAKELDREG